MKQDQVSASRRNLSTGVFYLFMVTITVVGMAIERYAANSPPIAGQAIVEFLAAAAILALLPLAISWAWSYVARRRGHLGQASQIVGVLAALVFGALFVLGGKQHKDRVIWHQADYEADLPFQEDSAYTIASVRHVADAAITGDLDHDALAAIERDLLGLVTKNLQAHDKKHNVPPLQPSEIVIVSEYVNAGRLKLAITKMRIRNQDNVVFVTGVWGGEMFRVSCAAKSLEPMSLIAGPCADRIERVFGVQLES
jgi:hypothetical protein